MAARWWAEKKSLRLRRYAKDGLRHSFEGHESRIYGTYFTLDGQKIVSGACDECRVWEVKTGECLSAFGPGKTSVQNVALSPDGKRLLLGCIGKWQLWEIETGKQLDHFFGTRC